VKASERRRNEKRPPARRGKTGALAEAGYTRLEHLTEVREAEISKLHGGGPRAVGEIRRALVEKDLRDINGWNEAGSASSHPGDTSSLTNGGK
jgi:hypothetical protein